VPDFDIPAAAMNKAPGNQSAFATFFMDHPLDRNSRFEGDMIDQRLSSANCDPAR
jgi:hypothetical protein